MSALDHIVYFVEKIHPTIEQKYNKLYKDIKQIILIYI